MRKLLASMILSCAIVFCAGQTTVVTATRYSFSEMVRQLKDRHYDLGYSPRLAARIPNVEMELSEEMSADSIMRVWLAGLKFGYKIDEGARHITLMYKGDTAAGASIYSDIEGVVINTSNEPLPGATLTIAGSSFSVSTNKTGHFRLPARGFVTRVSVSHIGCGTQAQLLSNKSSTVIVLLTAPEGLDKVIVQAYGRTSKRLNTGSIYVVSSGSEGFEEPSGSLQDVLEARVPGLFISEPNGIPGTAKLLSLGGTHSIQGNNQPLYVVDGVPLAADGFLTPIGTGSAQGPGGANSLNFIAPENIASMEVLKDASATSIYGSRASNGVILITLKTGRTGPLRVSFNVNSGVERVVHTSPLLSTPQFLQLRKEAVMNDGEPVDPATVPENYLWDSTRQTNFQQLTTGGTANVWNAGIQAAGGSARSYYLLSGQLHRETTVFPGATYDERRSLYSWIHSQNENGKLQFNFSGMYSSEGNHLPVADYTQYSLLAPNAPAFKNAAGQSQWGMPPLSFVNIPAWANNDYVGNVYTLFGHLQINYKVNEHLSFEESLGYNGVLTTEQSSFRLAGQDPNNFPVGQVSLAHNQYSHEMSETIGRWAGDAGPGRLEGLVGVDWQQRNTQYNSLVSSGYPNDVSLNAGVGATSYAPMSNTVPYRYAALFARVNYNVANKYLLTGSWRRDGSSRLGDREPIGDFWAVGAAWVFSEERFLAEDTGIVNFGKIRASYGTTGNEPNEDNQFMEVYTTTFPSRGYQGQQGLQPLTLSNPQLRWELNYREELGLEMELFHHRVWFSAAVSRSWTGNQLINTALGPVAGISRVLMNQPGIDVENRALEFVLQANRLALGPVSWTSALMLTVPRNKLAAWPGLATTSYATTYVIGHSLTTSQGYHWTGVDPKSGYYTFQTSNANGSPGPLDVVPNSGLDPSYYAGWSNSFRVSNWRLDVLFDYRRQRGYNPLVLLAQQNPPGSQGLFQISNGPVEWLDHWRKTGDLSRQQRVTSGADPVAMGRLNDYMVSDAVSMDASYLRLRNIMLSWYLPDGVARRWKLQDLRIYVSGRNLLTVTKFPVADPETQNPTVLPPMRIVVAGLQVKF